LSRAISGGSQSVSASAPMKMKSPPHGLRIVVEVARSAISIASSLTSRARRRPRSPPRR
jgi:hypothetical protein